MPFFTIIIPTYNSENTIEYCINSVSGQSFTDYEILVIDGLSTDGTVAIVKGIEDRRIGVFSERDKGIYDAMNKGIMMSKGEWLYFLGSDDALHDKNVLEYVYNAISENRLDVIYGNVRMIPSDRIYDGIFTYEKMRTVTLCHQAIFYNKRIFKDFGLYNIKYKVLADHDMNIKWLFSKKHKSEFVDRIIADYSETGFSSIHVDKAFEDNLSTKLLWSGLFTFPIVTLKELSIETAIIKRRNGEKFGYLFYLLSYYFFRILDVIKRKLFRNFK